MKLACMKYLFLIFVFFISHITLSQTSKKHVFDEYTTYHSTENIPITDIISLYDKQQFTTSTSKKIYYKLGNKYWWFQFKLPAQKDVQYFTISSPYISSADLYILSDTTITKLQHSSYTKSPPYKSFFYRHPVWKIKADSLKNSQVFLKLKNTGARTRLEFHLENENSFLKRTQKEYLQFGLFLAFLISMIAILLYFSLIKKEYSVIFYALYIVCMLIEFLAGKGLGIQFLWGDYTFVSSNIRSFSQTLGTTFIGIFYLQFYNFKKQYQWSKAIFKWGSILTIPLLLLYFFKFFIKGMGSLYLYVWLILKIIILIWFFNHLYLARKKQLPFYLVIAFALPILSILISQNINPYTHSSYLTIYGAANVFYIFLVFEILLFTYYIFSSVIATQRNYFKLKKISDELKYSFQNKTLQIQQIERNKLLSNVHDSFGGYLEALKLRLLNKENSTPDKIEAILNDFYKDYRYLLSSLYTPKINSENFNENVIEFFDKINQISPLQIEYKVLIKNTFISQEKCIHLYRIISELTTNAIKYSKASKIKVHIENKDKKLVLTIIDNGIGFNPQNISKNSYGINSVKERVEAMLGDFYINSKNKIGTHITITIPNVYDK